MIGGWELIAIAAVVVVLFGVNKIPKLGGAIAESILFTLNRKHSKL
jgi:Sec-independent protein translocase protein TatA